MKRLFNSIELWFVKRYSLRWRLYYTQEALKPGIDDETQTKHFNDGLKFEFLLQHVEYEKAIAKLKRKSPLSSEKQVLTEGYQPTDHLDTSNPPNE